MAIYDPTTGGAPTIGQPVLLSTTVNGKTEVQTYNWAGNVPVGYQIVSQSQALDALNRSSANEYDLKLTGALGGAQLSQFLQNPSSFAPSSAAAINQILAERDAATAKNQSYLTGLISTAAPNKMADQFLPDAPTPSTQYYKPEYVASYTAQNGFAPFANDTEKNAWLNEMKNRGITIDPNTLATSANLVQVAPGQYVPKGSAGALAQAAGPQPNPNPVQTMATPNTSTIKPPTTQLSTGSTGADVQALQNWLSTQINPKTGQPYLTKEQIATGPGIYGPQTTAAVKAWQENNGVDNSTGPGVWGPRTIAAATSTSPTAPPPSTISNPVTAPAAGGAPAVAGNLNLPTIGSGATAAANYGTSLQTTVDTLKKSLLDEAAKRAQDYQTKIDALTQQEKEYQQLQDAGMASMGDATTREIAEKRAAYELEQKQWKENYDANQALVGELDQLLTQSNQVVAQMQETTGLSSIMQPRISKTITDMQARAGVIEAVLNARNGQMANAQNQLNTALGAISSIYGDEIDYYKSVINYYGTLKNETGDKIASLSKDQKDYLDVKINMLSNDLQQAQDTTALVSKAMLDPDTAKAYAMAGVTLKDSVEQINAKLAQYSYSQEVVNQYNTMQTNGYTTTPIAGVSPVAIADSQGIVKLWYKAPTAGEGFTLGTNQVRFDAQGNVIAQGPKSADSGGSNPAKLASTEQQILLGAGFNSADITQIQSDVSAYGLAKVLEGITDPAQKAALNKVYGATAKVTREQITTSVTQKAAQDGLKAAYTQAELDKMARDKGYTGWFGITTDTDAFLNSADAKTAYVDYLYAQYKAQGLAE